MTFAEAVFHALRGCRIRRRGWGIGAPYLRWQSCEWGLVYAECLVHTSSGCSTLLKYSGGAFEAGASDWELHPDNVPASKAPPPPPAQEPACPPPVPPSPLPLSIPHQAGMNFETAMQYARQSALIRRASWSFNKPRLEYLTFVPGAGLYKITEGEESREKYEPSDCDRRFANDWEAYFYAPPSQAKFPAQEPLPPSAGLSFSQAMAHALLGAEIRRQCWMAGVRCKFLGELPPAMLSLTANGRLWRPYCVNSFDALRTDWEIFRPPPRGPEPAQEQEPDLAQEALKSHIVSAKKHLTAAEAIADA